MVDDTGDSVRQRLLDALVRITAEQGLDRVSIRQVATEAGVSIGAVQYYCRSKDEMLRMTFEYVTERITGRATAIEKTGPVGSVLRRGLLEFLPLDASRQVEARVYLAFAARAAVAPNLARVQHDMMAGLRARCAQAFRLAQERGQARADLDPDLAAAATAAMVDGLLLQMLTDPAGMPAAIAVAVLDAHLRQELDVGDAAGVHG